MKKVILKEKKEETISLLELSDYSYIGIQYVSKLWATKYNDLFTVVYLADENVSANKKFNSIQQLCEYYIKSNFDVFYFETNLQLKDWLKQ